MSDLPDDGTIFKPRRHAAPVDDDVDDLTARSDRARIWAEPDDTRVSPRSAPATRDVEPEDATRVSARLAETQPDLDNAGEPEVALTRRARRVAAAQTDAPPHPRATTAIRSGRGPLISEVPWQGVGGESVHRAASSPDAHTLRTAAAPIAHAPTIADRADVASPRSREREVDYATSLRTQRATARRRLTWVVVLGVTIVIAAAVALVLLLTL